MKPIGLYCKVCKKIVTLEEYDKAYQEYLEAEDKRHKQEVAERIARHNSPEYQAYRLEREAESKAKWRASYTATMEQKKKKQKKM